MAFKYLTVDLTKGNVKDKAIRLSKIVYRLSRPNPNPKDDTTELWGRIKHPTKQLGAMMFESTYEIPIKLKDRNGNWLTGAIDAYREIANILGYTEQQAKNFVQSRDSFVFEDLLPNNLPNGVDILFESDMFLDGWFDIDL